MNESTVSSTFQKLFRKMVPGAVLVKHADKSKIGMPDASLTFNKRTIWLEYKFIGPKTKGVTADFMLNGGWLPRRVAEASPTQFEMVKRLGTAGHSLYIFWVLDNKALKKKVGYILTWNPLTGDIKRRYSNKELVTYLHNMVTNGNTA